MCPADTVFPALLSCPVAPSLQAQLPDKDAPVDTSPVYVKGDPFAKTMYQDSEVGPRKRSRDEEDIIPVAELNEVIKNVAETVFDEQHRSFEYMDRDWLTKGEYETLEFRKKAHPPQFYEVKVVICWSLISPSSSSLTAAEIHLRVFAEIKAWRT